MIIIDFNEQLSMFDIVIFDGFMYQVTGYDDRHLFLDGINWDDEATTKDVDWNNIMIVEYED